MKYTSAIAIFLACIALLAPPPGAAAADEPETVYARFHAAGLAADFDGMRRNGSAARSAELQAMRATSRLRMLQAMAGTLPKAYDVTDKIIFPDGRHATLYLRAKPKSQSADKSAALTGTALLVKEMGEWKVDEASWGGEETGAPASQKW